MIPTENMEKEMIHKHALLVGGAIIVLLLGFALYSLFTSPSPAVTTSAGESFNVVAYANPSTGYSWNVSVDDPSIVSYLGGLGCAVPPPAGMVGAGCNETFGFRALSAGTTEIRMRYLRAWEANSTVQTRNVSVTVTP